MPSGPVRATKGNQDAAWITSRINNLDCIFKGAVAGVAHVQRLPHCPRPRRAATNRWVDRMKQRLKRWIFGLLRKDPEAVVVTFCSGPPDLCRRMVDEVQSLVPDRRHFAGAAMPILPSTSAT